MSNLANPKLRELKQKWLDGDFWEDRMGLYSVDSVCEDAISQLEDPYLPEPDEGESDWDLNDVCVACGKPVTTLGDTFCSDCDNDELAGVAV